LSGDSLHEPRIDNYLLWAIHRDLHVDFKRPRHDIQSFSLDRVVDKHHRIVHGGPSTLKRLAVARWVIVDVRIRYPVEPLEGR
jgi:hypothetical protein